ncbi:MAG: TetR/AcrR family transcriptional regulator [Marinobacter sp.]|uniref:TetR/AcrR family transcriptional regulator n=1 Tax=Marinobacter sp. TaxID=50741 RepID=UPI00299EB160|nr:TetR/AcrR family transcriptional regulator [Marinobacter sp.]MDX1757053.1 TetR/AcrR family transcriptional regulator [Marinobacter sp.]
MARQSKSDERRRQILDAFELVVLRDGYAGASQRKIAREAGINQPMLHHYFSGGEEMLDALLERVVERYTTALHQFLDDRQAPSLERLLGFLCSAEFHQVSERNGVFFALIAQGGHSEATHAKLIGLYRHFLQQIAEYLGCAGVDHPERIAYTLMCTVIGHDWAKKVGFGEERNAEISEVLLGWVKG